MREFSAVLMSEISSHKFFEHQRQFKGWRKTLARGWDQNVSVWSEADRTKEKGKETLSSSSRKPLGDLSGL